MSKIIQDKSLNQLTRRHFLTGLSFITAVSAISHHVNATESLNIDDLPSSMETKGDEKSSAVYRETQHIRDYYNSL